MAPDCTGVTSCHVTIVTILRNLDAEFLGYFIFELIKSLVRLRNDKLVAGTALSCTHYYHLQ